MKGKKLSTLLASVALISTVCGLASCNNPTNTSSQNSGSTSVTSGTSSQANSSTTSEASSSAKTVDFTVPEGGFDTTKDVTIKFYTTMGDTLQKVFNLYLEDEFAAAYPNIHVDAQFIGGYDDVRSQMTTELASGKTDVNVAYCYPDHIATYNSAKSVVCLDNLIEDDTYGYTTEEYNDYVEAFYEEGATFGDGKMYCLPFSKSTEVLYYNKTFFDTNNLSVPDHWFAETSNDTTSMEYVCKQIKTIDPDSIPLGYDSGSNLFITLCEQYGIPYTSATGNHYTFNNDEAKKLVTDLQGWYKSGYITTKDVYGSYTSGLFTSTDTQKCYMCVGSSAGASYQQPTDGRFEVGIAKIPQKDADATNAAAIQQGPDVCIFQNEDPQKVLASWLFIKWFTTNPYFQAQFSMVSGYMPVIKSAYENDAYKDWIEEGGIQAVSTQVSLQQEDWYFTSPSFVGSTEARNVVGEIITNVFTEQETVDSAFEKAIAKCNQN